MFILQPGQGLGQETSRQLAFALGSTALEIEPGKGYDYTPARRLPHPAWQAMERRLQAEMQSLLEGMAIAPVDLVETQAELEAGRDNVDIDLATIQLELARLEEARDADNVTIIDLKQQLEDLEALRQLALDIQRRRAAILTAIVAAIYYYF